MSAIEKNNTSTRHSRVGGNPESLITDNINIWSSATQTKKGVGRGSSKKLNLYGIKKLRELILELAVRGLLVPQDPNDEPASVLLDRASDEKNNLLEKKLIKKSQSFPDISEDEKYYEIPPKWEWVRLRDIGHDWGQKKPDDKFTYIDVGSINKELGFISEPNILEADNAPSRARKIVKKGTVLYSTVRPYLLNIAVIDKDFKSEPIASTAFAIIHPFKGFDEGYIYRYLRSPSFIKYVESCQTGIAYPAINDKQFFSGLIPIPPAAEQHRIVTKVDELMALCDQLEQQQENSITAHKILVETLLSALTNAADKGTFDQAWEKIANHFDTLFTTEHSIDQLKQTILQLAVMGKLVPQDPNDETASELLEKIAVEKERLIKEKKVKKQKELPKINNDEKLFKLPNGWQWCHLQEVVYLLGDGLHGTPEYTDNEKYYFVNGNNLKDGKIIIKHETKTVAQDQYNKYKKKLGDNTVLVSINGTLGSVAFYDNENVILGKSACYFNLVENICKKYIKTIICSPYFIKYAFRNATGSTIKNLGLKAMNNLPIALPPKNEQYRIVAKTDNLIFLCDQLRTNLNNAQTTQLHLADAMAGQVIN